MVKFLIQRPIAVIMTLLAFLGLGLICTFLLPVSLLPNIDIPEISIQISYPQLDAENLDKTIVKPIRTQLLQVSKLEEIKSESRDGNSIIKLRFDYGTDIDYTYLEVNEQIDALMQFFPRDMERPKVIRARASDLPVFHLNIMYKDGKQEDQMLELSEFCASVIKRRVEQLPEIAMADLSGLYKPEIVIEPNFNQLNSYGLSISDLSNIIKQNNINLGNIVIRDGFYQYHVNFSQQLNSIEDIENIFLKIDEKLIQLKEIASVKLLEQELKGSYYFNQKPAIVMSIIKQSDARLYDLQEEFEMLIQNFMDDYPELEFKVSQDQSKLLKVSINNLQQSLLYGSLLAFIIMFIVLGDIKTPMLIGISIPSSLIISLLIFYLLGLSINIVSLSGLLLGAGMMIDSSIIVIDNISQYRQKGLKIFEASIKGTNEVIRPLISSVLTTCAIFVPLIFLSNISGALFYDQAIAISVGLIVSLSVSIMILPVLYHLLNKKNEGHVSIKITSFKLINLYEKGLKIILGHPTISILVFLMFIPLGWYLFLNVQKQSLPKISRESFTIHLDWNEKNTITESKKRILQLHDYLNDTSIFMNAFIGEQDFILNREHQNSSSEVDLIFEMKSNKLRETQAKVEGFFSQQYPASSLSIFPTKNIFESVFQTDEADLSLLLYNTSSDGLPSPKDLEQIYQKINALNLVGIGDKLGLKESLLLKISSENIALYHINYNELLYKLRSLFNANKVDVIAYNQRMIPLKIGTEAKQLFEIINGTSITNKNKEEIPLRLIIQIEHLQTYKNIFGGMVGNYVPIPVEIKNENSELFLDQFSEILHDFPQLSYQLGGRILKNKQLFNEMIYVLIISVLLLYFILAAQFESIIQPIIILLEVLIDVSGALLLLYLFGASLNIMSAIGIIVMSGIVINDSILKVDTINQLRKSGLPTSLAILEAGKRRFNPIIMTSLTTILALAPLFFTTGMGVELQKPLALSIIGGMALGTIVSLYFIPLIYGLIYREKDYTQSKTVI